MTHAPLTPTNCDLRDFPRMMLDIVRLKGSSFDATLDDSAWRAGLNLWMTAWHQVPAASLPDEPAELAKGAGLGRDVRTWGKLRAVALRGWVKCDDGRLYHETLSEIALEAWIEKLGQRLSSDAGNAKRHGYAHDPAPAYAEIRATALLLIALNPKSKSLKKQHVEKAMKGAREVPKPSDPPPDDLPVGDPAGHPLASQEKGREGNIESDVIERAGAIDWAERLSLARAAADGALDATSTGTMHARDLRALCEPTSGEPCTWDEVMDAVIVCAARAKRRSEPIRSWSWIRDDALKLRDKRLNATNPEPRQAHDHDTPDTKLASRHDNYAAAARGAAAAAGRLGQH